ncbi:MAG TPA: DUF6766 family protein, partial [Verrucomicrobiae bacterium]|nr:DUF6766 family protein [Verrucomicrobiae bacterium]
MKWLHDNGLSLTLFALFVACVIGHAVTGQQVWNDELAKPGQAPLAFGPYLLGAHFNATLVENWESEFLQMTSYVVLTAYLIQRGSPESKDPDHAAIQDRDPKLDRSRLDAPWPVHAGGMVSTLYAHALGIALFVLFLASFGLHLFQSANHHAEQ